MGVSEHDSCYFRKCSSAPVRVKGSALFDDSLVKQRICNRPRATFVRLFIAARR